MSTTTVRRSLESTKLERIEAKRKKENDKVNAETDDTYPTIRPPRKDGTVRETTVNKNIKVPPQDAEILRHLMEGKSAHESVQEAGLDMNKHNANVYAEHIRKKYADANGHLIVELEKAGVGLDSLAEKVKEGLGATVQRKAGKDLVEAPDYATRHKYLETALGITGAKAPQKQEVEHTIKHEQTLTVVESIRENPSLLGVLQQRLENSRNVTEEVDEAEVSEVEEND